MISLSAGSLGVSIVVSGYMTLKCISPPNPLAGTTWKTDRVHLLYHPFTIKLAQILILAVALNHAYMVILLDLQDIPTQQLASLDQKLLQWSFTSSLCLATIIFVGAPLRLAAYGTLGKHFTFNLAPPNELNTSGVYRFVQHPSYTGLLHVAVPNLLFFPRWDGPIATWIPEIIHSDLEGFGSAAYVFIFAVIAQFLRLRIRDEEAMLKDVFGAKWIQWNKSTSRLIPGIF
jgi:protein-S-isoprenylcysteine O-methyltransferase Ste14